MFAWYCIFFLQFVKYTTTDTWLYSKGIFNQSFSTMWMEGEFHDVTPTKPTKFHSHFTVVNALYVKINRAASENQFADEINTKHYL